MNLFQRIASLYVMKERIDAIKYGKQELPPSVPSLIYHPPVDYNKPKSKSRGAKRKSAVTGKKAVGL